MEETNYTQTVPDNQHGSSIDAISTKNLPSLAHARSLFLLAKQRLLNINGWHKLTADGLATFQLFDRHGNQLNEPADEGHLIRIDIPGLGSQAADGFDWVKIEEVKLYEHEETQSLAIRVRPTSTPDGSEVTAHFYSQDSTSTFTLTREATQVTAAIYDRNVEINKESANMIDKVRNAVTGFAGKKVFSKLQWQSLADGLIS